MRPVLRLLTLCSLLLWPAVLAAEDEASPGTGRWLGGSELAELFGGKSIDGHYANGKTFAEDYAENGTLQYRERDRSAGGRWSVEAETFCTIYDHDSSGGCYRVRRVSNNCFEFYFVARTEEQARRSPGLPSWTARGWYRSKPATCADGASV